MQMKQIIIRGKRNVTLQFLSWAMDENRVSNRFLGSNQSLWEGTEL